MIPRLTDEALHPDSFHTCQLCGTTYEDICELRMWEECGDSDEIEPGNYLIVGDKCCRQKIYDHSRMYREEAWGKGRPGAFILLCGDCPWRKGFTCSHSNLKSNGGEGLLVTGFNPLPVMHINYGFNDPRTGFVDFTVANGCEGHPTKSPKKVQSK